MIDLAEVGRLVRYAAVPLGVWATASTFVLARSSPDLNITTTGGGALVVALSLPRGPVHERYGTGQRYAR